jgi:uncharacterized protein (TIGR00730 family)
VTRGLTVVDGGASIGLMGAMADEVARLGGRVIGVIPQGLVEKEIAHAGLAELHVVDSMHARKAKMADLADAFVALPGSIGTLEELFEVWTWSQMGIHAKPCAVLNVEGYYDGLLAFLDHAVAEGFLRPDRRATLLAGTDPGELLVRLAAFRVPTADPILRKSET